MKRGEADASVSESEEESGSEKPIRSIHQSSQGEVPSEHDEGPSSIIMNQRDVRTLGQANDNSEADTKLKAQIRDLQAQLKQLDSDIVMQKGFARKHGADLVPLKREYAELQKKAEST